MSDEAQAGFRSGLWGKVFGLPSLPLLYVVGGTELVTGLALLGYCFLGDSVVPSIIAQWSASLGAFATLQAAAAHSANGDPLEKVVFPGILCAIFSILTCLIASSRVGEFDKDKLA